MIDEKIAKAIEDAKFNYHQFLYTLPQNSKTHWHGTLLQKNPLDLWIYTEIIQRVKPDVIVECGTALGSSASFFSTMQRTVKPDGFVITIDENTDAFSHELGIFNKELFDSDWILFLTGKTQDSKLVNTVYNQIKEGDIVLVSLDAGHEKDQVAEELKLYSPLVTIGSYIVVEDSNIGVNIETGYEGPREAISEFLAKNTYFIQDFSCEKFGVTYNPGGWLKRIK